MRAYQKVGERQTALYEMLTNHSYDLPDDVFEAGEVKPAKKKKAKAAKPSAEPSSRKRTVDEANMDVRILWREMLQKLPIPIFP